MDTQVPTPLSCESDVGENDQCLLSDVRESESKNHFRKKMFVVMLCLAVGGVAVAKMKDVTAPKANVADLTVLTENPATSPAIISGAFVMSTIPPSSQIILEDLNTGIKKAISQLAKKDAKDASNCFTAPGIKSDLKTCLPAEDDVHLTFSNASQSTSALTKWKVSYMIVSNLPEKSGSLVPADVIKERLTASFQGTGAYVALKNQMIDAATSSQDEAMGEEGQMIDAATSSQDEGMGEKGQMIDAKSSQDEEVGENDAKTSSQDEKVGEDEKPHRKKSGDFPKARMLSISGLTDVILDPPATNMLPTVQVYPGKWKPAIFGALKLHVDQSPQYFLKTSPTAPNTMSIYDAAQQTLTDAFKQLIGTVPAPDGKSMTTDTFVTNVRPRFFVEGAPKSTFNLIVHYEIFLGKLLLSNTKGGFNQENMDGNLGNLLYNRAQSLKIHRVVPTLTKDAIDTAIQKTGNVPMKVVGMVPDKLRFAGEVSCEGADDCIAVGGTCVAGVCRPVNDCQSYLGLSPGDQKDLTVTQSEKTWLKGKFSTTEWHYKSGDGCLCMQSKWPYLNGLHMCKGTQAFVDVTIDSKPLTKGTTKPPPSEWQVTFSDKDETGTAKQYTPATWKRTGAVTEMNTEMNTGNAGVTYYETGGEQFGKPSLDFGNTVTGNHYVYSMCFPAGKGTVTFKMSAPVSYGQEKARPSDNVKCINGGLTAEPQGIELELDEIGIKSKKAITANQCTKDTDCSGTPGTKCFNAMCTTVTPTALNYGAPCVQKWKMAKQCVPKFTYKGILHDSCIPNDDKLKDKTKKELGKYWCSATPLYVDGEGIGCVAC